MHLRDPELGRDLGLRHLLEEAELDDAPYAGVEGFEAGGEKPLVVDSLVAGLGPRELLATGSRVGERVEYACAASSASITSSSSTAAASASSAIVGDRPSVVVRS